jgi:hypothetical protein
MYKGAFGKACIQPKKQIWRYLYLGLDDRICEYIAPENKASNKNEYHEKTVPGLLPGNC